MINETTSSLSITDWITLAIGILTVLLGGPGTYKLGKYVITIRRDKKKKKIEKRATLLARIDGVKDSLCNDIGDLKKKVDGLDRRVECVDDKVQDILKIERLAHPDIYQAIFDKKN